MFKLRMEVAGPGEGDGRTTLSVHDTLEQAQAVAMVHYRVPLDRWVEGHGGRHWIAGGEIGAPFRGRFQIREY